MVCLKLQLYLDVCTEQTGHAEVVQEVYNPSIVPYEELQHNLGQPRLHAGNAAIGRHWHAVHIWNILHYTTTPRNWRQNVEQETNYHQYLFKFYVHLRPCTKQCFIVLQHPPPVYIGCFNMYTICTIPWGLVFEIRH